APKRDRPLRPLFGARAQPQPARSGTPVPLPLPDRVSRPDRHRDEHRRSGGPAGRTVLPSRRERGDRHDRPRRRRGDAAREPLPRLGALGLPLPRPHRARRRGHHLLPHPLPRGPHRDRDAVLLQHGPHRGRRPRILPDLL
ncbi:MAG: hypothetical protein AVDCRST_MAG15-20, partial [uncultured Rubellimicrobium sp.]